MCVETRGAPATNRRCCSCAENIIPIATRVDLKVYDGINVGNAFAFEMEREIKESNKEFSDDA